MKVLVVDDDPISRKLIGKILTNNGYQAITAESVIEAVNALDNNHDMGLIISDVMMPGASGIDFLKLLKEKAGFADIPVLMCTALGDKESVLECARMGARDYVVKPVEADALLKKIIKLTGHKAQKTILVVDDEKTVRDVLKITLERAGYDVCLAENGEQALSVIEKRDIAMAICDVVMPKMDGLELLAKVKASMPSLPVFMITGMSGKYRAENVTAAGADGFIAKPFSNMDIVEAVKNGLQKG
jgi:CheY-like chemotaxis protein